MGRASSECGVSFDVCTACFAGIVFPVHKVGRTRRGVDGRTMLVPSSIAIPTCESCGVEFVDDVTAAALAKLDEHQEDSR